MNTKAVIPLVAGLGIAGLAAKLGLDYVKKAQGSQAKTVDLWTVVEDVPRGVAIEDVMLSQLKFPVEVAPKNAIADKTKIVGRVPHTGVPSGVPVLDSMLLAPGAKAGVFVPPGFRAVAVKIDESSGVDNHMQPGCRVDVVGYFTVKNSTGKAETIARTIIENVEVAAVGQRIAAEAPAKSDPKDKKSSSPAKEKPARAATLLVKPEQVPILLLAEQKGEIKLSMRGLDDATIAGRDDKIKERDVTGGEDEPPPLKDPGLGDMIAGLFDQKKAEPVPMPEPEPVVEAAPPVPQYESTMVIYLGNEKRVLGWIAGKPNEPVEIGSQEGNIFEPQEPKPAKPADKKTKGRPEADAPADAPTQPQPEPEQPPTELIG